MADEKISGVPAVVAPVGTDQYATNQGGVSKSTTLAQIIAAVAAGDVFKVGTPLINEIGVWTGDGTIRGFAGFEFAGGQFTLPNYSFPVADGAADQVLVTDGLGVLSYKDQASGGGGLLSATYLFDTSTVAADPGAGNVRYNNSDPSLVTAIYIDAIDENAVDVTNILSLITTNDRLYLQTKEDASQFVVFNVTAPITDNTGWFTITGTVEASGNLHSNGEPILVLLQIGGAAGGGGDVFKVGTPANNQLGVWTGDGTIEGDPNFQVVGTSFQGVLGSGPELRNVAGVNINPRKGDTDTGIASRGDNRLGLVAQGVDGIKLIGASTAVLQQHNTTVGLTAFAGGGQGSATQLNSSYSVIDTVATPGDSVKFSTTLEVGVVNYVKNDGANALDLFPAAGDDLGLGVGVAISVAAGKSVAFIGTVVGSTSTQFIFQEVSGDLTKVGTPLINQIAVWDGDGPVRGDPNFLLSGTQLILPAGSSAGLPELKIGNGQTGFFSSGATQLRVTVDGTERFTFTSDTIQGFLAGSARMVNRVSSLTVPTFVPNTNDDNTGIGSPAGDILSLIAGGVSGAQVQATGLQTVDGTVGAPSYSFVGEPTMGLIRLGGNFGFVTDGVLRWAINNTELTANLSGGPLFRGAVVASATVPTIMPNNTDINTGIGWNGADELTIVTGGMERATFAVGGVEIFANVIATGDIRILGANSPELLAEASSATNPTVLPNRADSDTGIGGVAGVLSLIQNGVESAQGATPAAGGLLVNNALTGAGLERALTVSDLLPNDVVQARRTTDFTLTTAFVDVTLDTTDIETDPAVIEHVDLATDNIEVMVAGTYKIGYEVDAGATTTGDSNTTLDGRVRLNDTSVIAGSEAKCGVFEDASLDGDFFDCHLSQTFYVTLAANDFVTLQLEKVEIAGTETYVADRILFTAERCL